jgi:hypothetical protein
MSNTGLVLISLVFQALPQQVAAWYAEFRADSLASQAD